MVLWKPDFNVVMVLHYLEPIKLQQKHKVWFKLLWMLLLDLQQQWIIKHFADQIRVKLTSQLINDISSFLRKLLYILMAPVFQHLLCHHYQFELLFWTLNVSETASYEITLLLHWSFCPLVTKFSRLIISFFWYCAWW